MAGLPPTTVLAGTSLVTKAFAPTMAFSPTVIPGRIVAAAPIQAFLLIVIGLTIRLLLCLDFVDGSQLVN